MESGEQQPPRRRRRPLCSSLVHLKASCRRPVAGEADGRDVPRDTVADPGDWATSPRSCCSGRRPCPARGCLGSKAAVRDAQPTSRFQLNLPGGRAALGPRETPPTLQHRETGVRAPVFHPGVGGWWMLPSRPFGSKVGSLPPCPGWPLQATDAPHGPLSPPPPSQEPQPGQNGPRRCSRQDTGRLREGAGTGAAGRAILLQGSPPMVGGGSQRAETQETARLPPLPGRPRHSLGLPGSRST